MVPSYVSHFYLSKTLCQSEANRNCPKQQCLANPVSNAQIRIINADIRALLI